MRRGAFVEVDGVYIAFDDVDKANGIGFFPARAFTQNAGEFEVRAVGEILVPEAYPANGYGLRLEDECKQCRGGVSGKLTSVTVYFLIALIFGAGRWFLCSRRHRRGRRL